jgi:hypothetical protein
MKSARWVKTWGALDLLRGDSAFPLKASATLRFSKALELTVQASTATIAPDT